MTATQTIPDVVRDVLRSAEVNGQILTLTCGQLDRPTYAAVNKVLEAMGGKWNRKAGGHVFPDDPTDLLSAALEEGEVTDKKKQFQAYYTPEDLAQHLVDMADIRDTDLVLEPSAGGGSLLRAIPQGAALQVHYCEIQPESAGKLWREFNGKAIHVASNFLTYRPGPVYDKVVANPPFTRQQDIEHVTHMLDCCKPGGRVVSVMSPGFTFREDRKSEAFRRELTACTAYTVTLLEDDTFKQAGTSVKAVIVCIDK